MSKNYSNANKVLVISWHFPPYKSSSAFNLFKRLKDTGYEYDVLQIKRADKPDNEDMFQYANSRFNRYEIEVPVEDSRNPDARAHFVRKVLDFYGRLKDHNHYRVMISHSHEIASHLAAMELKKQNPNLRWAASFGDPIAANPYNKSYNFPMLEEDSLTEAKVLQVADRIIVTNPYQQAIVSKNQTQHIDSNKFFVLPHCFDERMYPELDIESLAKTDEKKIYRFMHVGMLYKFKRTSEPFILGAQRMLQKYPELKGRFTLEFYGANDRYIQAAADYGLDDVVKFKGTVTYLESLNVMTQADCLLLRDADFSDEGVQTSPFYPGKLADYLGAKKPVLAVTMKRGCVPDMLGKLGGASHTETDIDGIATSMFAAIQGELTINFDEAKYYSHHKTAARAREALSFQKDKKKILIAGHDLKFAKFIMEKIEEHEGLELLVDKWDGHDKHNEEESFRLLDQADSIFCEWGLGNLVWYSKHKKAGQKLVTRVHAQELKTRHLDRCLHEKIDHYIFVSPNYFELMIAEFSLEREKCKMIFNMVDTELLDKPKLNNVEFNLGLIGDVPRLKRLDRALDIFEKLYGIDNRYKLFIKGKRPEDYPWMHSKSKESELFYYQQQYDRIDRNNWGANVSFEGFGPIDEWLKKIGWILSTSDQESFHLAVAEGITSGAKPVIMGWQGSEFIYPQNHIFKSIDEAVNFIHSSECGSTSQLKNFSNKRFSKNKNTSQLLSLL